MRRRTLLAGALAAPLLTYAPTVAAAASSKYATVILSPHQDDETIRLSAYIAYMSDRGDNLALINVCDGSATVVKDRLGLSRDQTIRWRNREQDHAWANLTDGRGGPITRLGFPDRGAERVKIRNAVRAQLETMTGKPELYVATWHHDKAGAYIPKRGAGDGHPDHVACVLAARDLAAEGVTVRYAHHPSTSPGKRGARYRANDHQELRIEGAVAAYKVIGQRSVRDTFEAVVARRGETVVTT